MASSSSSSSSSSEDADVVIEILSRLPVKSLVRFKCVRKSWYDLIKSPYFIKKHLERNIINENDAPLVFVTVFRTIGSALWISSTSSSRNNSTEAATLLEEEIPSINPVSLPFSIDGIDCPHIAGHVKGIYCCEANSRSDHESFFLCNPALREVKKIPEIPPPAMTEADSRSLIESGYAQYGFGYDSRNNDFKLVAIRRTNWLRNSTVSKCVFLYTLSTNSWKKMDSKNIPDEPSTQYSVFVSHGNGVVYWAQSYTKTILSFDLGTELFRELAMPDAIEDHEDAYIAVFNDSLVAIRKPEPKVHKEYYYEFWVMKEYDVNNMSWTKLYNIGPLFKVTRPLRFWNNGEILFEKKEKKLNHLLSYNPRSQQIKDLHIHMPLQIVTYMESLVSIDGDDYTG